MRLLPLLLLGLLAALPARAQASDDSSTVLMALAQIPADPGWWGDSRVVAVVDLAALKRVAGVGPAVTLVDFVKHRLTPEAELAATSLLWRLYGTASFRDYLLSGPEIWPEQLGFDFLALDWFSEPGNPPGNILLLGGDAPPRGAALKVLGNAGLAPVEHGGTTLWVKGEKDYSQDLKNREPGFPFWGNLGSAVRLFRGEHAMVGARSWKDIDLALAVERGAAEDLADLPRFRLAAEAAGQADYSSGPILQMTFVDQALGKGELAAVEGGLPPYELLAFADREDASGQQLVLVLSYGSDAAATAAVAALLPDRLAAYRDKGGKSLADRLPGLSVSTASLETGNGAAAVAVLSLPPLPVKNEDGKVQNRSLLYALFVRMLYSRDLSFLAPQSQ